MRRIVSGMLPDKKRLKPQDKKPDVLSMFSNIKDDLGLISILIFAAGIVFVDSYYQAFGVRMESLTGSTWALIYKGLLMILNYPGILLPYLLILLVLVFEPYLMNKTWWIKFRIVLMYSILFFVLLIIYGLASYLGKKRALKDMSLSTSSLSKILVFETKSDTLQAPERTLLLLIVDADFVYVFEPTTNIESQVPVIQRYSKSEVATIKTQL